MLPQSHGPPYWKYVGGLLVLLSLGAGGVAGLQVEDAMSLHDGGGGARVVFGCEGRETGEIYRQKADGLLGLGNSEASVVNQVRGWGRPHRCLPAGQAPSLPACWAVPRHWSRASLGCLGSSGMHRGQLA